MKAVLLNLMLTMFLILAGCNGLSYDLEHSNNQDQDNKSEETMGDGQAEQEMENEDHGVELPAELLNDTKVENGTNYIQNPDNILVLVNKEYSLPVGYRADDLVKPEVTFSFSGEHEKQLMRKEAAEALEKMFAAASGEGIEIAAVSGFRSYDRQVQIYNAEIAAL